MNRTSRLLSLAISLSWVAGAAYADKPGEPHLVCRDIRAEIHELFTTDNCTSPLAFCSAGTIDGNFGLEGTTFFSVDGSATTPVESPGTSSFTGIFTITTDRGTLTLRETGISYPRRGNPEGGVLATIDEVLSGTGRFATRVASFSSTGTTDAACLPTLRPPAICV